MAANPWRSLRGLPTTVWWLALATLVNRAGTMVLPFMALYLTRCLGWSPQQAALILVFYGASSLLAGPTSGRLCDRYGAGRVMACSLLCSALVMLAFPLAHSFRAVALATVCLSLTSEAFRPAGMAVLSELLPADQRKQGFALNRLAVNLGMSIGPVVGGILAGRWFPAVFLADGVTALLSTLLLARLFLVGGHSSPSTSAERTGLPAWRNPRFLTFLAGVFTVGLVFFQLDSAMPLHLVENLGLDERQFGLMFTVNTSLIILFELPLNAATADWPLTRSLLVGCAFIGLGFGSLALVHTAGQAALTVVVWTIGEMILFPAQSAQVSALSPGGRNGEYMGLFTSTFGLAFTLGPALGVYLLGRLGPGALWPLTFLVALTAGWLMYRSGLETNLETGR
ncbi:MAG: MFS transporter [Candidatus Eremiobacteraeota bacterium]|nr:MFS transporter [Candidatus Eremiobacteraeota bacterium]